MATPELLGLLCAGTMNYHGALGGHASQLLTKAELAGLLSGLSVEALDLAMAKYAGCHQSERRLILKVMSWAVDLAVAEEWEIVRGRPTVCNMATLSVLEVVRPNRCGTCHGAGYKGARLCMSCNGAGTKALAGTVIAESCGLMQQDFSRNWKQRYDRVYRHVAGLDGQVNGVLRRD